MYYMFSGVFVKGNMVTLQMCHSMGISTLPFLIYSLLWTTFSRNCLKIHSGTTDIIVQVEEIYSYIDPEKYFLP